MLSVGPRLKNFSESQYTDETFGGPLSHQADRSKNAKWSFPLRTIFQKLLPPVHLGSCANIQSMMPDLVASHVVMKMLIGCLIEQINLPSLLPRGGRGKSGCNISQQHVLDVHDLDVLLNTLDGL